MGRRGLLLLFLLAACLPPARAQVIRVEEFAQQHRPIWKIFDPPEDKDFALLDFATEEKGFTFLAGGKPADAEEGDGMVTVKLPHRTAYVTIQHPDFGQLVWRVPGGKLLKKRRHYRALLIAFDPTKDYKAPRQWVVFHLDPKDVLVQIDSVKGPVRGETAEYLLPVGEHSYRVEAPFHDPVEGTFTLTDSVRTDIRVALQPFWSYLTVKTPWPEGEVQVDGTALSREQATSFRLAEGPHRVTLYLSGICFYDSLLVVGRAEKKVLELTAEDLRPKNRLKSDPLVMTPPAPGPDGGNADSAVSGAVVKLTAPDEETEIWLDRERVGVGSWEGWLEPGFHLASTRRDGLESDQVRLWIDSDFPQEIALAAPGTGYGLLSVSCNVPGARISIDGDDYGEAPQIVRLDATRSYELVLSKPGFRDARKKVRPRGNHQTDVYLKMKKR